VSALEQQRAWARLGACRNHVRWLALGILNYHDEHKCLPWPNYPDASGRPAHSWRTTVLPGMCGWIGVYHQYRFDEPWDGPSNRQLLPSDVFYHYCPDDATSQSNFMTSYLAVVGPETMWPGQRNVRLQDITDGASNTIMLVETLSSGIYWLEPRDLEWDQMEWRVGAAPGKGISSAHRGGANVAMADGSVRALPADLDPQTLAALLTIRGGEQVDLP